MKLNYSILFSVQKPYRSFFVLSLLGVMFQLSKGQSLSLIELQELTVNNNFSLKAEIEKSKADHALIKSAFEVEQGQLYYSYDQANLSTDNTILEVVGFSQNFKWPSYYKARKNLYKSLEHLRETEIAITKRTYKKEVGKLFYALRYTQQVKSLYIKLDSLYHLFAKKNKATMNSGNGLEQMSAQAKEQELAILMEQINLEHEKNFFRLKKWLHLDTLIAINKNAPLKAKLTTLSLEENPTLVLYEKKKKYLNSANEVDQREKLPDLQGEVFTAVNALFSDKPYSGFQVGIGVPLFTQSYKAKKRAYELNSKSIDYEKQDYQASLKAHYNELLQDLKIYEMALNYYENTGNHLSKELTKKATQAYQAGDIDYLDYLSLLDNVKDLHLNYYDNLLHYNETIIELNYLQ